MIPELEVAFKHLFEDTEYSKLYFSLDVSIIGRARLAIRIDND